MGCWLTTVTLPFLHDLLNISEVFVSIVISEGEVIFTLTLRSKFLLRSPVGGEDTTVWFWVHESWMVGFKKVLDKTTAKGFVQPKTKCL